MGLLSRAARGLAGSRMAALSRAGATPFAERGPSPFSASIIDRAAAGGMQSDIDPRAILGGGAALMGPTGLATAKGLEAYRPLENQMQAENRWTSDADLRTQALRLVLHGVRPEEISDPQLAQAVAEVMRGEAGAPAQTAMAGTTLGVR